MFVIIKDIKDRIEIFNRVLEIIKWQSRFEEELKENDRIEKYSN